MSKQPSITNFFARGSTSSACKRKYGDLVDDLLKEAELKFTSSKKKVTNSKKAAEENKQGGSTQNEVLKPKTSYKRYTLEQKEAVISLVPYLSYAEIERKFGVDEASARRWVKNGVAEDRRKNNGKEAKTSELEEELTQILRNKRAAGIPVTDKVIYKEVQSLYMSRYKISEKDYTLLQSYARYCAKKKIHPGSMLYKTSLEPISSFTKNSEETELSIADSTQLRDAFIKIKSNLVIIGKDWLSKFIKRNKFSYRRVTHTSAKSSSEVEKEVLSFVTDVHRLREEHDIPPELILNFDETAIFYDTMPFYTYEVIGTKHPHLKATKVQKKRLTAGLGVSAAGDKLNPMLIYKGSGTRFRNLTNTHGYDLRKNENAWMTSQLFRDYLKSEIKFYLARQRKQAHLKDKKALFIIDGFSGHKLEDKEKEVLEKDLNLIIKYLPPYTTSLLQPLDLNINGLLKRSMKDSWVCWFNRESVAPSKQAIYTWFASAWRGITPLNIIKGFLASGISNDINGNEDILSSNLRRLRESEKGHETEPIDAGEAMAKFFEDPYSHHEFQDNDLGQQDGEYICEAEEGGSPVQETLVLTEAERLDDDQLDDLSNHRVNEQNRGDKKGNLSAPKPLVLTKARRSPDDEVDDQRVSEDRVNEQTRENEDLTFSEDHVNQQKRSNHNLSLPKPLVLTKARRSPDDEVDDQRVSEDRVNKQNCENYQDTRVFLKLKPPKTISDQEKKQKPTQSPFPYRLKVSTIKDGSIEEENVF